MKCISFFTLIILLLTGCSKDSSSPTPEVENPSTPITNSGGTGGGTTATVNFSYLVDGSLLEQSDANCTNDVQNRGITFESFQDTMISSVNENIRMIYIELMNLKIDEVVINQEYYCSNFGNLNGDPWAFISFFDGTYESDETSAGFVKITDINLNNSTISGEFESVLWEYSGPGYKVLENGSFTNIPFTDY